MTFLTLRTGAVESTTKAAAQREYIPLTQYADERQETKAIDTSVLQPAEGRDEDARAVTQQTRGNKAGSSLLLSFPCLASTPPPAQKMTLLGMPATSLCRYEAPPPQLSAEEETDWEPLQNQQVTVLSD